MRESFVIHTEYIEDLPEENKAEFLMYIYNYGSKGIEPELSGFAKTVWLKIQRRIDADIEQYENTINARSAAGKKHKGNQYTKDLEQSGTNGTQFQSMEQDGTNGTVYVSDTVNDSENECVNTPARVCAEPHGIGKIQKDCFILVQEHNSSAPKERKIPCSNNFISFMQKEMRELLGAVGTEEPPERVLSALQNFIKVAKSDTWQKTFTWRSFCKNYQNFTPEYFTLSKYLTTEPETEDATQKPEYKFFMRMRTEARFHVETFQAHIDEWKAEGRPEGEDYFKLQDKWEVA